MSGHRPERTFHENGERNVCELDHYADKSYLGIHYWDLCWKLAYPKLKKIEIQISRHEKRYRSEEIAPASSRLDGMFSKSWNIWYLMVDMVNPWSTPDFRLPSCVQMYKSWLILLYFWLLPTFFFIKIFFAFAK